MPIPQGRFVWHDLATTDVEGAKNFYTKLTPWTTKPWEEDESYTLVEREGMPLGGMIALPTDVTTNGSHPSWTPSVYVYDVDACSRQAVKLGGKVVMPPREIPNVGCWAIIADPDGATIALFEPSSGPPPGHDGPPLVSEFSWHELMSNDWKKSWEFYQQLFHWEKIDEHDMGERLGTYFIFGVKGQALGGMFTRNPDMPPPSWTSYIQVDSVKSAVPKVKQLGGQVMREPQQVPGGSWISICSDPQGAMFAMTSMQE